MFFQKVITDCGAPLYVLEMPHAQSVACGILVKVGSVDEKWPEEAGLAHAFEHMVFQGNKKFKSSKKIGAYIEEVGGYNNAWTWKEMTFFHVLVPKNHFSRSFAWLYHLLSAPLFAPKNIKTEMQNVIQEIKRRNDNPSELSSDVFEEVVYKGNPLAQDTLGKIESVGAFTQRHFLTYHEKFYNTQNFVFIAVGNVKMEQARNFINEHEWRSAKCTQPTRTVCGVTCEKHIEVVEKSAIEQVHAHIGTLIGPARERSTDALQLFVTMIDGGSSFPLFQEVRDKRGLCYAVSAGITPWTDRGVFSVYIGTDPKRYTEAIQIIKRVIQRCTCDEGLFKRAKKLLEGSIALGYENPNSILRSAAMNTIFNGKPKSPEEVIQKIESITFEEVKNACAHYLNPENFTEVCIAPKGFVVKP